MVMLCISQTFCLSRQKKTSRKSIPLRVNVGIDYMHTYELFVCDDYTRVSVLNPWCDPQVKDAALTAMNTVHDFK